MRGFKLHCDTESYRLTEGWRCLVFKWGIPLNLNKKYTYSLVLILLFLIAASAVFIFWPRKEISTERQSLPLVTVIDLHPVNITMTLKSYAVVASPSSVILRAETEGQISGIYFKAGQLVKKGQLLVAIKTNNPANQLRLLAAELKLAKDRYDRFMQLKKMDPGAITPTQLLQITTTYQGALAQYQEASSVGNIVSPIDGIISDTELTIGSFVTSGAEIASIVNPTDLQIKYQLPARLGKLVAKGNIVIFKPEGLGQRYFAKVGYISPALSYGDYSFTLRANLSGRPPLPLNTFGQVLQTVVLQKRVMAIPQVLVKTNDKGAYVYVVDNDRVARQYFSQDNVTSSGFVVVKAGINADTRIISSDASELNVGQKIRIAQS